MSLIQPNQERNESNLPQSTSPIGPYWEGTRGIHVPLGHGLPREVGEAGWSQAGWYEHLSSANHQVSDQPLSITHISLNCHFVWPSALLRQGQSPSYTF